MTPLISACIDGRVGCVRALLQSPEADVRHHVDTLIHHVTSTVEARCLLALPPRSAAGRSPAFPLLALQALLAAAVCCARGEHS